MHPYIHGKATKYIRVQTFAVSPEIDFGILCHSRREMAVVRGGNVNDATQVLRHPDGGTLVGLVPCAQLTVAVGSPGPQAALVAQGQRVGIPAHDLWRETVIT